MKYQRNIWTKRTSIVIFTTIFLTFPSPSIDKHESANGPTKVFWQSNCSSLAIRRHISGILRRRGGFFQEVTYFIGRQFVRFSQNHYQSEQKQTDSIIKIEVGCSKKQKNSLLTTMKISMKIQMNKFVYRSVLGTTNIVS